MNRLIANTVCCIACFAVTSLADAQFVRVGPFGGVSVRAPFVSVDTLPFGGGARVRAPFTSVNTRAFALGYGSVYRPYGYGYYRPFGIYDPVPVYRVYPAPMYSPPVYPEVVYPDVSYPPAGSVYPQTGQYHVARPPVENPTATTTALPQRLRSSAARLKQSLSTRRDDADIWLTYLGPDRIVETIDTAADPNSLSELLRNYEGVVGNGTLGSIRSAPGFDETRRLLREFVDTTAMAPSTTGQPAAVDDADSVPIPVPIPQPNTEDSNAGAKQPTPAAPIKPAAGDKKDDAEEKDAEQGSEELPLPTPTPL